MKYIVITLLVLILIIIEAMPVTAQEAKRETIEIFHKSYPTVWKCVRQVLSEAGCSVASEKSNEMEGGIRKGEMTSTSHILASGLDTTEEVMERYALRIPYIRGATWSLVQIKYMFYVTENSDHSVEVKLQGEMSGYEEYVTEMFHYFESNGILEHQLMEQLKYLIALAQDEESGTTDIQDFIWQTGITVYPNPLTTTLTLKPSDNKTKRWLVYDMRGRVIIDSIIRGTTEFDTKAWANGAYILLVLIDNAIYKCPLIKQ